jgi:hypothetical protein
LDVQTGKSTGMVPVFPLALPRFEIPPALNFSHARRFTIQTRQRKYERSRELARQE